MATSINTGKSNGNSNKNSGVQSSNQQDTPQAQHRPTGETPNKNHGFDQQEQSAAKATNEMNARVADNSPETSPVPNDPNTDDHGNLNKMYVDDKNEIDETPHRQDPSSIHQESGGGMRNQPGMPPDLQMTPDIQKSPGGTDNRH